MKKLALVGVFSSACSLTAVGALPSHVIDFSGAFVITEPTTLNAVTNRYPDAGAAHAIHADLTLDQNSYLRLGDKGTSSSTWSLAVGSEPGENPTITVKGGSVFLTTYRDTKGFLDDADDGSVQPSYLYATMGANGGSGGKFIVQDAPYSGYGGNNSKNPLWMEKLTVSANAQTTAETFDVLQLDGKGFADITTIVNENDKPVRILFNGGYLRKNYMNSRGDSLAPAAGKTIIAEGINGHDIHFIRQFGSYKVAGGSGTVIFRGNCDLRLSNSGENYPGVGNQNRGSYLISKSASRIQWDYTGDLVVDDNGWLLVDGDDLLPYGKGKGGIRLEGTSALDLNGFSAKVNSLVATTTADGSKTKVTNVTDKASAKVSTLVFGADDMDGVFSAFCCKNVNVEKIGTGTLVVSNVTMEGTLTVKAGKVKFVGTNRFATPPVFEDGAVCLAELVPSTDTIKTFSVLEDADCEIEYTKKGSDELCVSAGEKLSGARLSVAEGTLRFTGKVTDKWWKFAIKESAATGQSISRSEKSDEPATSSSPSFNVLALWPSNVTVMATKGEMKSTEPYGPKHMLTFGLQSNETAKVEEIGSDYAKLPAGTFVLKAKNGTIRDYADNTPGTSYAHDALFNRGSQWIVSFDNAKCKVSDESTWANVILRLPDDAPPAASYGLCATYWSCEPIEWRISSSADGVNWTVRDDHRAKYVWEATQAATWPEAHAMSELPCCGYDVRYDAGTTMTYNNGVVYRFTQGGTTAEPLEDVKVEVAAGATLDTRYLANEVLSFKELTVDLTAGAGTITKFRPAADGVLYLKNPRVADLRDGSLVSRVTLPLTVGEIVDAANLASWKVYVDGVLSSESTLLVKDGQLVVKTPSGLLVIIR